VDECKPLLLGSARLGKDGAGGDGVVALTGLSAAVVGVPVRPAHCCFIVYPVRTRRTLLPGRATRSLLSST